MHNYQKLLCLVSNCLSEKCSTSLTTLMIFREYEQCITKSSTIVGTYIRMITVEIWVFIQEPKSRETTRGEPVIPSITPKVLDGVIKLDRRSVSIFSVKTLQYLIILVTVISCCSIC